MKQNHTIIGAGLVGCLLGTYLAKAGHSVEVFERRPDPRKAATYEGRSFNLVLSQRGVTALRSAGVEDRIMPITTRLPGRIIHTTDGKECYQPYGSADYECLHAISRASLNRALLDIAEDSGDLRIHFDTKCDDYDVKSETLKLSRSDGSKFDVRTPRVFGTDGSASSIRNRLSQLTNTEATKENACYGYKELYIPAKDGKHVMEPNAFHVWPRGKYVMTGQANIDGSFSGALFLHTQGNPSFDTITEDNIEEFFKSEFPDLPQKMPNLRNDYVKNPVGNLCTVRCPKWYFEDKIVLLGDAAHAIVPFYGQGTNCGFEDVMSLTRQINAHTPNWENVFTNFEKDRKPNADAIADLSLANMREMSEGIADPKVLMAKEIAHRLAVRYPKEIICTHAMVTSHPEFSYSEAKCRGEVLDKITLDMARSLDNPDQADLELARKRVLAEYLA